MISDYLQKLLNKLSKDDKHPLDDRCIVRLENGKTCTIGELRKTDKQKKSPFGD